MTSRRLYSTNSTVFISKCREALRSKRPELPARMPPSCNDGQTQKTLIPYYVKPTSKSSLALNLPNSIFESHNLKVRFEKEQKIETELWVKAAYLHEFKAKGGKSQKITLKPFVEEFMKSGKADPYLTYYLEKHRDQLTSIVRDLSQKRNDILKHSTFWKMEEASKDEKSFLAVKRVTIQELKEASKEIQDAKTPEEQVIAVQKYIKLRELYVKPNSQETSSSVPSHLTAAEIHKMRVDTEMNRLFKSIIVDRVDPNTLTDRIKALKEDYSRLQKMCSPSEEIDLYDVYMLEQNLMKSSDAARRFLDKAKRVLSPEDEEKIKILVSFLESEEKDIQKSLKSDKHRTIRKAFLIASRNRSILESTYSMESKDAMKVYEDFMKQHEQYINGSIDMLEENNSEFKVLFDIMRSLYQLKRKISADSPFRHVSNIEGAFSSLKLKDLNVAKELQTYEETRAAQESFLQAHYQECASILSKEDYDKKFKEQIEILQTRTSDETLSFALQELTDIVEDVVENRGLQDYNNLVGNSQTFENDLKYLENFAGLAKHVRRINSLESVFGVNAIDKSLELLDTYNIKLEPPRYRRYLQSDVPAYKLRWVDTYSAHPIKKQRAHDRKVKLTVTEASLKEKLSPTAFDRLVHIAGKHYKHGAKKLVLQGAMFPTREENIQYVTNLMGSLIREAQKADLDSDYIIPASIDKLTPLEKLALRYPNVESEDVQSHDLLSHWIAYLRKGKMAGADELYGEGLEHQAGIAFEGGRKEDTIDFENIEEVSTEEFEEYLQNLQSV